MDRCDNHVLVAEKSGWWQNGNMPAAMVETNRRWHSGEEIISSLKAKADARRTGAEKLADGMVGQFGTISFFTVNLMWFLVWMAINLGWVPGVPVFDPFPFGLLTMVVSLEAIFLSIIVLISQNRAAKLYDIRAETDLQVDITAERELTKILEVVTQMAKKQGVDLSQDKILQEMLQPTDTERIEQIVEKQVSNG